MLKQLLTVIVIATSLQQASASAMSPELSKCLSLRALAKDHKAWKGEFMRFQATADDELTADQKFELQRITLDLVLKRLIKAQALSGFENNNRGLINETSRFLQTLDSKMIARPPARYFMTSAIPKFEEALDDTFYRASIKNQSCEILPNSNGSSSNSGSGSNSHK